MRSSSPSFFGFAVWKGHLCKGGEKFAGLHLSFFHKTGIMLRVSSLRRILREL